MKKIFLGLFVSAAMLTSCDMDTTHYGVIDQGSAIQSVDDAHNFLNGLYVGFRSKTANNYIVFPDVQMDQFVGLIDNGNRLGPLSTGQIMSNDTDLTNMYYNLYILINSVNYYEPKMQALIDGGEFSENDVLELKYYLGSAKFMRAYCYWYLFDKYVNYSTANLETPGMGLQIEKEYHPSGDRSSYVGRSTIKETVDYITTELNDALTMVQAYEAAGNTEACNPNANRISSYVIQALQARFALLIGDYQTALNKAEAVINSGNYELCDVDTYPNIWVNDNGTELLFVPYTVQNQGGMATGRQYYTNSSKENSDYIPTASTLLAYEDGDVRFDCFFEVYQPMVVAGEDFVAFAFNKYPGNPALNTGTTNSNLNAGKPFRLSEQYLIAAEAAAAEGPQKNETKANSYLNDLRAKRIEGYSPRDYSGAALVSAIRAERGKELIGEGFRLSDLRRWGNGFTRNADFSTLGAPLDAIESVVTPTTNGLTYQANDYRFIWPIPFREMQVNPQLKGQQNPRY